MAPSRAGVTQLAECLLPKQNVAGSNPVSRSISLYRAQSDSPCRATHQGCGSGSPKPHATSGNPQGLAARVRLVERYDTAEAAERAGLTVEELSRLVELGILASDGDGSFTAGDVRRAGLVDSLAKAGIPLDGLSVAMKSGRVSLDFLGQPAYERFSALSGITFAQLAERSGVPVELLMLIREATGSSPPMPDDRVRDGELPYAAFIELQVGAGFDQLAIERLLRAAGDSLRRLAETGSAWWRSSSRGSRRCWPRPGCTAASSILLRCASWTSAGTPA